MIRPLKRFSRKGQDLSITTLILIVLGVVVLVLLVLGFTKGWDWITSKFDILPGQSLETVAQSCKIAVQSNLIVDFCSFKAVKVDGVSQYVNCMDSRVTPSISGEDNYNEVSAKCASPATEQAYCKVQLKAGDKSVLKDDRAECGSGSTRKGYINGRSCCS